MYIYKGQSDCCLPFWFSPYLISKVTNLVQETEKEGNVLHASGFINAFQLIAMSHDLDLSRLFEEQVIKIIKTLLSSQYKSKVFFH